MPPLHLDLADATFEFELEEIDGTLRISIAGQTHDVRIIDDTSPALLLVDDQPVQLAWDGPQVIDGGIRAEVSDRDGFDSPNMRRTEISELKAPMPGRVVSISCEVGQEVEQGQPLLVLEAMKMENEVRSPRRGVIEAILVHPGASLEAATPLVRFSKDG